MSILVLIAGSTDCDSKVFVVVMFYEHCARNTWLSRTNFAICKNSNLWNFNFFLQYGLCTSFLKNCHFKWEKALAQLLSLLWQKFLTELFLQKLYFLFLEILNSKQMVQVYLFFFCLPNLKNKSWAYSNSGLPPDSLRHCSICLTYSSLFRHNCGLDC